MYQYKQQGHSQWCASIGGSPAEPCNCPASELVENIKYPCDKCSKIYGLPHGLETHKRMKHKL